MNMLRLLSAGKSLVGLRDSGKQYRMLDVRSLPKFGSGTRRDRVERKSSAEKFQTPTAAKEKLQATEKLQAPSSKLHPPSSKALWRTGRSSKSEAPDVQAEGDGNVQGKSSPSPLTPLPQERETESWFAKLKSSRSARAPVPQGTKSWLAKVKALFSRSKAARRTTIPLGAAPVQCELSLDNVKVLRNDLSDTDFEVVAKSVQPEKPSAPATQDVPVQPRPASEPSRERIWNRVTTLLGAGQT